MATFMDVHSGMQGLTLEQLRQEHEKDLKAEKGKGVHFIKAWADPTTGKVFCLAEGPDKESVARIHQEAGHPADEIYELPFSVE